MNSRMSEQLPSIDVRFTLGDAFRKARKLRGLGIVHLAKRAGVDKGVLVRIEADRPVERPSLEKVAKALGVTVAQLEEVLSPSKVPRADELRRSLTAALAMLDDTPPALEQSAATRERTGS